MSVTDLRSRTLLVRLLVHELVSRYGTDQPETTALDATLASWREPLDEDAIQEAVRMWHDWQAHHGAARR